MTMKEWLDTDINLAPTMKVLGVAGAICIALYVVAGITDRKPTSEERQGDVIRSVVRSVCGNVPGHVSSDGVVVCDVK